MTHSSAPTPERLSQPMPSRHRNLLLALVVILWLSGTGIMLWWFQSKQVRPFLSATDDPVSVQASYLQGELSSVMVRANLPASNAVTLVHFWNPDCLCNQLSQRHFDALLAAHPADELRILVVAPAGTEPSKIDEFNQLNGERMQIIRLQPGELEIPSSPALALIHPHGQLGYFGAWGFGALCSVASDDFFPSMVRKMLAGPYGPFVNISGSGCFCAWPAETSSAGES